MRTPAKFIDPYVHNRVVLAYPILLQLRFGVARSASTGGGVHHTPLDVMGLAISKGRKQPRDLETNPSGAIFTKPVDRLSYILKLLNRSVVSLFAISYFPRFRNSPFPKRYIIAIS